MKIILKRKNILQLTGRSLAVECVEGFTFRKNDEIQIDFQGITLVSQSFLNELFKIIFNYTGNLNLTFINMDLLVEKVVVKEFERVKSKVIPNL